MSNLKPCPFCGSSSLKVLHSLGDATVYCMNCNASSGCYETEELAKEAWNSRKHEITIEALLERIEELMKWYKHDEFVVNYDLGWYEALDQVRFDITGE